VTAKVAAIEITNTITTIQESRRLLKASVGFIKALSSFGIQHANPEKNNNLNVSVHDRNGFFNRQFAEYGVML
jgi:hypothetical protein